MTGKPVDPRSSGNDEIIAATETVILYANGVFSALLGSWIPTGVALAVIAGAGMYLWLPTRNRG